MIATIEIPLDGDTRKDITARMSEAMGAFVEAMGTTDFADWDQEKWEMFVGCAYDICASAVFMKRIIVTPPAILSEPGELG